MAGRLIALAVCVVAVILPLGLDRALRRAFPVPTQGAVILLTGASSGIGRDACLSLAARGDQLTVYCGVRTAADRDEIIEASGGRVRGLILDVTKNDEIEAAADAIGASGLPLAGLINNAGIAGWCPTEGQPVEDVRRIFDVNYFGVLRLTQRLLPQLRAAQGRIIGISSIGGVVRPPFGLGAYAASKHALETMSDALRVEMLPFNVSVSLIEPAFVRSDVISTAAKSSMYGSSCFKHAATAKPAYSWLLDSDHLERFWDGGMARASPPSVTTDAIMHALLDPYPRTRYMVAQSLGMPAWFIAALDRLLPDRLNDRLLFATAL